jgi:hypothetical protein
VKIGKIRIFKEYFKKNRVRDSEGHVYNKHKNKFNLANLLCDLHEIHRVVSRKNTK